MEWQDNERYDEKKERSYQNRIWYVLLGVAVLCLLVLLGNLGKETYLLLKGECIKAEYYEGSFQKTARYYDEEGKLYTWDLTGIRVNVEDGMLRMYYEKELGKAIPLTPWWLWLVYYGFFGAMAGLCIWRIHKNR